MLRRSVRVVAAECSHGQTFSRVAAWRSSPVHPSHYSVNRLIKRPALLDLSVPISNRAFGTTSRKGKEKEEEYAEEEHDQVIQLLSSVIKKRSFLTRQKDWTTNVEIAKEVSDLDELYKLWNEWQKVNKSLASLLRMTTPQVEPDEEMRNLALEEARTTLESLDDLRERIRSAILPHNPVDDGSAILEVRMGIGGEESALFVGEVSRMYSRYCENLLDEEIGRPAFQVEQINAIPTETVMSMDAFREVILQIKGKGAYKLLKNEAGIHRVQRIPATQKNISKLQSSTIAVLVLPGGDADGNDSDTQVKDDIVDPKDVKQEVMRSRGAGGQHVNKTESAVRLTHEPTGITVSMQDSRSQHQNRTKAWAILRARLQDRKMREEQSQNRSARKLQMGGMDRGDRIRTYNFPQDRVTDHRVPTNSSGISEIMNGETDGGLAYLIDAIGRHYELLTLQDMQQQVEDEIVLLEKALQS